MGLAHTFVLVFPGGMWSQGYRGAMKNRYTEPKRYDGCPAYISTKWESNSVLPDVFRLADIGANPGERSKTRNAKIPAIMAPDGAAISGISIPMPPQGDEQNQKATVKGVRSFSRGSTGGSITNNQEITELLFVWAELDDSARRDLLAVARGWVNVAP